MISVCQVNMKINSEKKYKIYREVEWTVLQGMHIDNQ